MHAPPNAPTIVLVAAAITITCVSQAHSRQPHPKTVAAYWKEAQVRKARVAALKTPTDRKQLATHWKVRTSHISGLKRFIKTACADSVAEPAPQCDGAKTELNTYRQAQVALIDSLVNAGKVHPWSLMHYSQLIYNSADVHAVYGAAPTTKWMRTLSDRLEAKSAADIKAEGGVKARAKTKGMYCTFRYASDKSQRNRAFLEATKGDVVVTCHFAKAPAAAKGGLTDFWQFAQHDGIVNKRVQRWVLWNEPVKRPSKKKTVSITIPAGDLVVRNGTLARFVVMYQLHWDEKIKRGRAVTYRQHNRLFSSSKVYLQAPKMTKRPKLKKIPR